LHLHVKNGDVIFGPVPEPPQCFHGQSGCARVHLPQLCLAGQDAPVGGIVVHNQHALVPEYRLSVFQIGAGRRGSGLGLYGEMEGGALAQLTLDPHGAPHHLAQPLADGQAQPRAPVAACSRGINLAEGVKEAVDPIMWNPDAGIPDDKVEHLLAAFRVGRGTGQLLTRHIESDFALIGELDSIAEQVHQDLAQTSDISDDSLRGIDIDEIGQI